MIRLNRFNPRAHVGRDYEKRGNLFFSKVSIHAPTWGATCGFALLNEQCSSFNPRAHVGRDMLIGREINMT